MKRAKVDVKYSEPMTQNQKTRALAACINRASREYGWSQKWSSHNYWHVRETCLEIAVDHGLKWAEIVKEVEELNDLFLADVTIIEMTEPFWLKVMPPEFLCQMVLES